MQLDSTLESATRVSKRILPALKRLGLKTVRDLLFHFPSRYDDFSNLKPIREVKVGEIVTVQGKIQKVSVSRTARKRMVLVSVRLSDDSGSIKATWFNQLFLARNFRAGQTVSLSGRVALGPAGVYLQNPAYEKLNSNQLPVSNLHTGGLVAIYPESHGLTSRWLRFLIKNFIEFRREFKDPLPPETRRKYNLPEIAEAIYSIHFPRAFGETERARRRFNFEELFLIQLRALLERIHLKENRAPAIPLNLPLIKEFVRSLPYELTDAQRRSIWEIVQDVAKPRPMNRLLEGDVGSGKTVVAAVASLLVVKAGFRVVFMAPTEILARQHFETLSRALFPFGVNTGLLLGAEKRVDEGSGIIVGTHALIQDKVCFERLGLVVVDEQHRFGVDQRKALVRGRTTTGTPSLDTPSLPHFLSMSATPIPRTLALTVYGDLDLSILDELPKSRKQIVTKIVDPGKRNDTYQFMREEVKKGRQVFVVCPRIEVAGDDKLLATKSVQQKLLLAEVKSVKEEYKKLSEDIFSDLRVGMLHGKMPAKGGSASGGKSKDQIMKDFRDGEIDILVATSVVEVGVDVPNATIMMIEGAERFGLAQLHQFRGRVGRGAEQSYCFLFPSEDGFITRRLHAVVEAKNGFELAEKDLEIRGPGDIFGTRQWGISGGVLEALTDAKLVRAVRAEAAEVLKKDPTLKSYPALRERLDKMKKEIHPE